MENQPTFVTRLVGVTAEDVIEDCKGQFTPFGNDIDLLTIAMSLLMAGHYRESMAHSCLVQLRSSSEPHLPEKIDKTTAQTAFLEATERARHLFQAAAREVDGGGQHSKVMEQFSQIVEMLKHDPNW